MPASTVKLPTLATFLAVLAACGAEASPTPGVGSSEQALRAGQPQRFLVLLHPAVGDAAAAEAGNAGLAGLREAAQAEAYARSKASVLSEGGAGVEVVQEYAALPAMHVLVNSADALDRLRSRPDVEGVVEDRPNELFLAESLPFIHQPQAYANGADGAGTSVAVLDTGVDYTRAAFGTCPAPGAPGCRVAYAADFAPDDHALDANGHGTNVAGIVAGVAPGARILALDVFNGQYAYSSDILSAIDWTIQQRATYNIVAINMSLGAGSSTGPCGSDVFAGSVHAAKAAGIVVAVASGNSGWSDRISSPACTPDAVSVGAVYDSTYSSLGWGSCTDAAPRPDGVVCFSNSSPYLTLLAPGVNVLAAGVSMSGTSQATPHVAGAVAVLRGADASLTPDQTVTALQLGGVQVTDARNGVKKSRIDLASVAVTGCPASLGATFVALGGEGGSATVAMATPGSCSWTAVPGASWLQVSPASGSGAATLTFSAGPNPGAARTTTVAVGGKTVTLTQAADRTAPVGTVAIAGTPAWVRSRSVALSLAASDRGGVAGMCLSNTTSCTAWRPFSATSSWSLAAGASGARRVYAWFKDAAGNVSAPVSASTVYDVTPPVGGAVRAGAGDAQVALSWSGFKDAHSGLASYLVMGSAGAAPGLGCTTGVLLYQGTGTSTTHRTLQNGTTYQYRVCAVDQVGNVSPGAVASAKPVPETVAPQGTISIREGPVVRWLSVNLVLSAQDPSGVAAMCVSNGATCTTWEPYATGKAWALAAGQSGARTVRVWFRDAWGNASTSAAAATVIYDVSPPTGGTVTAAPAAGRMSLSWSGFSDAGSGVASYRMVAGPGVAPASCLTGLLIYEGTATSIIHQGLAAGSTWGYRVCALDRLGNLSSGATRVATVPR